MFSIYKIKVIYTYKRYIHVYIQNVFTYTYTYKVYIRMQKGTDTKGIWIYTYLSIHTYIYLVYTYTVQKLIVVKKYCNYSFYLLRTIPGGRYTSRVQEGYKHTQKRFMRSKEGIGFLRVLTYTDAPGQTLAPTSTLVGHDPTAGQVPTKGWTWDLTVLSEVGNSGTWPSPSVY